MATPHTDIPEPNRVEETLEALYRASLAIQEPLALTDRLERLLETTRTVLELDRVNILLADSEGQWLQAVASTGTTEPLEAIRVPIGPEGGSVAQAYLTRQPFIWDGQAPVPEVMRLKPPYNQIEALRSRVFVNLPLVVQGRAIGVLGADRKHSRRPLEPATVEPLQLFAAQAALAIEHARLYEAQRLAALQLETTVETRTRELQAANARLQQALNRAEEASRTKSRFLATMSHELRTPLNAIIGFSELLEDQQFGPLNAKQQRYVSHVEASGRHLLNLINDILDLAKVEADRLGLEPTPFTLPEVLKAALDGFRPQAAVKEIEFQLRLETCPKMLVADPLRFKQIVLNLLSNAVKFTLDGGTVAVSATKVYGSSFTVHERGEDAYQPSTMSRERREAFVEIVVQDTGIGIREDDLPKLFQEFTQLDASFARRHEGTGLGLALTKKLVELHGGTIHAHSPGEGQGTTFTVTLPLEGPRALASPPDRPPAIAEAVFIQSTDVREAMKNEEL